MNRSGIQLFVNVTLLSYYKYGEYVMMIKFIRSHIVPL